jgi:hypothetical protein
MYGEVFQSLVADGCWRVLERANVWPGPILSHKALKTIWWQGKEQNLYEVPMEMLNLSVRPYNRLRRGGLTSIGDCIDFYWRWRSGDWWGNMRFSEADFDELEAQLMALDCWNFIVEQYNE